MAFAVNFTRRADRDVAAAEAGVSRSGAAAVARWRARLLRAVENLEYDPHCYPEADEAADLGINLRMALLGRKPQMHRILFTIDGETVTVLRVRHAAQDRLTEDDL